MYSYKLNNSYTIYVNYQYYSDCHKICNAKKKKAMDDKSYCLAKIAETKKKAAQKVATLPLNTVVWHKIYGKGIVTECEFTGFISIAFGEITKMFQYPKAFQQGYLMYS